MFGPMHTDPPTGRDTIAALRTVAHALGQDCAYQKGGSFYFPLDGPWTLGISPDDAGRFRVAAVYGRTEVGTMWGLAGDLGRLADLARTLHAEALALSRV